MKSRSISTLSLALIISTAPALHANEQENSSWLAPFTGNAVIYPALALGSCLLAYKLYTYYTEPSELTVIAPWQKEERMPAQEIPVTVNYALPVTQPATTTADTLTFSAIENVIETGLEVFMRANGPQLVSLHNQLQNPALTSEDEREIKSMISEYEQQAPPLKETLPPLIMYVSLLTVLQDELQSQARTNRSIVSSEYTALQETVETIIAFTSNYLEIYTKDIELDFMAELHQQLEREFNDYTQAPVL